MQFIGIDLAWGARNTTAAVALRLGSDGCLEATAHADALRRDDDIMAWVAGVDEGQGLVVGVDAPLDVPNQTGERPVEAALRRCFGRYQAGAHPANRERFENEVRGERLAERLTSERGIADDFRIRPGDPATRCCLEVFPHPAHVVLFGLERTLKYKARPGRDYTSRYAEYARLLAELRALERGDPALRPPSWLASAEGLIGGALKRYEDLLDALMCAYVAAYYWRWGDGERCMVIGDAQTGYVISPITPALRACIESFFTARAEYDRPPDVSPSVEQNL